MVNYRELIIIASGGAVGAVGRYLVSGWAHHWLGTRLAYGTLTVNVLGCFLIGLLAHTAIATTAVSPSVRLAIGVGFLGAFTTFSTFGLETFDFIEAGQWWRAVANVVANLLLGFVAVWLGLSLARMIVGNA